MGKNTNYIILIDETKLTVARYIGYLNGEFHYNTNYSEDENDNRQIEEKPIINDHIIIGFTGLEISNKVSSETKFKHNVILDDIKNFIDSSNANFLEVNKNNKDKLQFEFDNQDQKIIVIPGIYKTTTMDEKKKYLHKYYDGKKDIYYYIDKAVYRQMYNFMNKMPGTALYNFNNVLRIENKKFEEYSYVGRRSYVHYIANIYSDSFDENVEIKDINDYCEKLKYIAEDDINVDLFISHQSKDKDPYIQYVVEQFRIENPQKILWYDKYFFKSGKGASSEYARNTIFHGIVNSKNIVIFMSQNYFDKVLYNIDKNAKYFGVNYELSLIYNLKNLLDVNNKLDKIKVFYSPFTFKEEEHNYNIYNFSEYKEITDSVFVNNLLSENNIENLLNEVQNTTIQQLRTMNDIYEFCQDNRRTD